MELQIASNSLQLIWKAFSFIFQASPIVRLSKFASQEYEDKSQKCSISNEGKTISLSMLSVFSSHHSRSCFPSEQILAGVSEFPLFKIDTLFKALIQEIHTRNDSPNDFCQIPDGRLINSEQI